jgi:hypothetical protein
VDFFARARRTPRHNAPMNSKAAEPRAAAVAALGRHRAERFHQRDNPVIWVVIVGAMLLAVPLMSEWINTPRAALARAPHTSGGLSVAEAPNERKEPVPPARDAIAAQPEPAAPVQPPPPPLPAELLHSPALPAARQYVTKCIEHGRVVYTQSGACTLGQMSALPVEPDKNVVGPGVNKPRER